MSFQSIRRSTVPHRRALVAAAIGIAALAGVMPSASAGTATGATAPLSEPPTLAAACDTSTNTSTVTITWPIGEYGSWRVGSVEYLVLSGGPVTYTSVTSVTYSVPNGWQAVPTTFRLNNNPTDNATGNNQTHLGASGETCPFNPGIDIDANCEAGTFSATIAAGTVRRYVVEDVSIPSAPVVLDDYAAGFFSSGLAAPLTIGPLPLNGASRIRVTAVVNGDQYVVEEAVRCSCTWTSRKDFSNVIVQYADGTEVRFDGLGGRTFTIPNDPDNPIVAIWIKAGTQRLDPLDPAPLTFHDRGIGVYYSVDNCDLT